MANIYDNRRIWKTVFLAVSLVLVAFFLHISNNLVDDLPTRNASVWRFGPTPQRR